MSNIATSQSGEGKGPKVFERSVGTDKVETLVRGMDGSITVQTRTTATDRADKGSAQVAPANPIQRLLSEATRVLMPVAYPPSFVTYCKWQFLQTITGQVAGILAMQAVLSSVGFGSTITPSDAAPNATVAVGADKALSDSVDGSESGGLFAALTSVTLAASARLIIKDLLGQLGGMLYGAMFSARFDTDAKRQRFLATIVEMLSNLLEVLTPFFPGVFLLLAGIANMGKNISMMATGATRAQMHMSFLVENNLGDITAKITSQTMGACFFGMGLGVIITTYTQDSLYLQLVAFAILATLCIWTCVVSSLAVEFKTLNYERAELLTHHALVKLAGTRSLLDADPTEALSILTPSQIPKLEHVVLPFTSEFSVPLEWDPSFAEVSSMQDLHTFKSYVIQANVTGKRKTVRLWVAKSASDSETLVGFLHACVLRFELASSSNNAPNDLVLGTKRFVDAFAPKFSAALVAQGWQLDNFAPDKTRSVDLRD